MQPSVVVIVLTWCNEAEAADCIESLARSRGIRPTILLVDNASPDGSGERLRARFPEIEYLQTGHNGGYTAGNNRGMEWALAHGADYMVVLNDDTIVDPACISTLLRTAQETGAAVVTPQMLYYDEPDVVWYAGGTFSRMRAVGNHHGENQPLDPRGSRASVSFVCGCCFLIRSDVVHELGGFDERFFTYVEDTELSVRLTRAGHTLIYEPTARLLHRIGRAAPATPFQIRQRDRNRRRLVARHFRFLERVRFALWFYPTRALHLARYVVRLDWLRARSILEGAFGSIRE